MELPMRLWQEEKGNIELLDQGRYFFLWMHNKSQTERSHNSK
jgi:hypothetical protein